MAQSISRRSFVTGMAASAAAGCTLAAGTAAAAQPAAPQTADQQVPWSFEIAPDPVDESLISDTIEADVVVIGSGPSGLVTALSCLQNGVDVVLFSASSRPMGRGGSHQAFGSSYQKEMGIDYDPTAEAMKRTVRMEQHGASYMTDQKKWSRWIANSGASMDWMIDIMRSHGLSLMLEPGYDDPEGLLTTPPSSHCFYTDEMPMGPVTGAPLASQAFADEYTAAGGMLHYDTVAKYLEREDGGRVSAAVAQRADGTYVRYVGRKAVVLATGDFSRDRDMMARYCPWAYDVFKDTIEFDKVDYNTGDSFSGIYPGDGHKMGLWVGAAWQHNGAAAAMVNGGGLGPKDHYAANFWGINLDRNGKRFMNEVTNFAYGAWSILMNPGRNAYLVWDSEYARKRDEWIDWGCAYGNVNGMLPRTPEEEVARWEAQVEAGNWCKADTLEDLLTQLEGIDATEALASIERYNAYAEQGYDEEFQVVPEALRPIKTAPFYGVKTKISDDFSGGSVPCFLTVCGGLRTDEHMRVCDADDQPIEGLYNVGIMTGDFYSGCYSFAVFGQNLGCCCLTLPWLLGQELAAL